MKLALVLLLAAATSALAAPVAKVDPKQLSEHVRVLSSDAFEGRGPATEGERKTLAYLTKQFEGLGLEPGGDLGKNGKRAWTQAVPLGRFEITGPMAASFGGQGWSEPLAQGEQVAIRPPLTNQSQVAIKDAPLIFVGYGVSAPERQWDDFKGVDVKGKMLVVLVNDPDFESGAGKFGGKAMTYYGRWTYKYEEAARRGALGVLIVHETAPAAYGWATVKNSNTGAQFDIVRPDPAKAHAPIEAWMQRDTAVALFKHAGLDFDALKQAAQKDDFKPVPLTGAAFSASFAVKHEVITSYNLAARIVGTAKPDETIIYSAHWDHLGVGEPDSKGDKIYNGALDNADGLAALLETARLFNAGQSPRRSVVFLAVTAEEKGLLGSAYYAAHPLYPLNKTVAVINTDALDMSGPARDMSSPGSGQNSLQDDLARELATEGRVYTPDPTPEAGSFYRSDHFSFAQVGVPSISLKSGQDLLVGGREAGAKAKAAYTRDRYHQPADEWSASWDFSAQAKDIDVAYRVGKALAEGSAWPQWTPTSEFKPIRDASAKDRQ